MKFAQIDSIDLKISVLSHVIPFFTLNKSAGASMAVPVRCRLAPAAPGAPRSRTTWPRPKPGRPNPPGEGRDRWIYGDPNMVYI